MDRVRVFLNVCRKTRSDNVSYQIPAHLKVSFILSSVIDPMKVVLERKLRSGWTIKSVTLLAVKTQTEVSFG